MPVFDRVLIANRGEIACRVIKACRTLGLETIAIHSDADVGALHTQLADRSIAIGPAAARESYLNCARIIDAALSIGAQAVHPGYGFLSESPHFAQAVQNAGLWWIGPAADTMSAMGDKARARAIALDARVPVLPGSNKLGLAEQRGLVAAASGVGYPLLVKAAAGGGGIGMRRVNNEEELLSVTSATQMHAARVFGDGAIYLERFIPRAWHVEIQVFGDGAGGAVHMFERDCTVQRRFQKIIEESPAPGLTAATRESLLAAAVRLAAAQRYTGPGTVEFLIDAATSEFYFLEMNTRIQVEHPVTEMATGIDIVAAQIRQARGEPVSLSQDDIRAQGHAIECRLYAENPQAGFRPSPGKLNVFALPEEDEAIRVDTGYRAGDSISIHYDPLLAKVIARGPTRARAIDRLLQALDRTHVEGLHSNLAFLKRILMHPLFSHGRVHTQFVEEHAAELASV